MKSLMFLIFVSLFVFTSGCDEQHCMSGDRTRCDGHVIQECDGYVWVDVEDCVESEFGPFCDQLEGGDAYCTDGSY